MPTAVNDVVLETKPAAIHADSAKESSIGEAMERAPVARLATRQTMVGRMGTQCYALLEDTKQKSSKKVRFNPQMPNAIWIADSNYDRRSIVVDLSKTPFALFRKDAVLMAKSNGAQPPPRSAVAACTQSAVASTADGRCLCARQNSPENIELKRLGSSAASRANDTGATAGTVSGPSVPSLATTSSTEAAASTAVGCSSSGVAAAAAVAAVAVGLPETTETRQRSQFFGSWDSDESDSAGHTDTEDISEHSEGCDGDAERRSEEPAFYGVWRRESSEGYEELLLSSGVPKRAAAIALRKHPVHIIDHDGSYFRLIVKNGLSKVDNTFFIGDEPREDIVNNQCYEMSMSWVDLCGNGKRNELALSSICRQRGEEVIAIRSLTDGGNRMVLTQVVRRSRDNHVMRAKHYFKRVTDRSELRKNAGISVSSNIIVTRS